MALRGLLNVDDDGRIITNNYFRKSAMNNDTISISTRLGTSFSSLPSTMPNTPCWYSPSRSARVPVSILNPDSANEVQNNRFQSELKLTEIMPVNDAVKIAQLSIVRHRKEKGKGERTL